MQYRFDYAYDSLLYTSKGREQFKKEVYNYNKQCLIEIFRSLTNAPILLDHLSYSEILLSGIYASQKSKTVYVRLFHIRIL